MIDTWNKKMEELLKGAELSGLDKKPEPVVETESEKKPNYLLPQGSEQEKDELLPGLGGGAWQTNGSTAEKTPSATDAALDEALRALASNFSAAGAPSATESAMQTAASNSLAASEALRESATQKSDTLYDTLMAYAGKQDGRYDALIDQISNKGYAGFAGVRDLLSYYETQGGRAARNAAASGAADNGGNPDSYAAAQAARQRLDFTDAGTEAALSYYNSQIDNWLAALRAAGADATALYGLAQDNVDGTHEAATAEGKQGESIFASLSDMQNTEKEANADAFSALLSHYSKVKESAGDTKSTAETEEVSVSPMEIDREYERMLNPENGVYPQYSATDALIVLWKKYPSMHDYLLQKYDQVLNPGYNFSE